MSADAGAPATPSAAAFLNLAAVLSRLLGAADVSTLDAAILTCLEKLGTYAGVDLAFVTLADPAGTVTDDWHWHHAGDPGAAPEVGSPLTATFGSATAFLALGHALAIDDIAEVELSPSERAMAQDNDLRGIAMAPVLLDGRLFGVVGLQTHGRPGGWDRAVTGQLETLSQLLVQAVYRTRQQGALALADARARRIAEYLSDGLLMAGIDRSISWASPSFRRISGLVAEEITTRSAEDLFHESDADAFRRQWTAACSGADARLTTRICGPRGDWRWVEVALHLASDPTSAVPDEVVVSVHDCHDRHLRERRVARQRDRDALTGAASVAGFERAVRALGADNVLVAFCDVDDFKAVNDTFGHDAGDEVLRAVAAALQKVVGPRGIVGRLGGDEFTVVVPIFGAGTPAWGLGTALVEAIATQGAGVPAVSVSVGVCGPGPATDVAEMRTSADQAMYEAKRAGKNQWALANIDEPVPA